MPLWTYGIIGIQLWGSAKKSNLNKIQSFQNITLWQITNDPPYNQAIDLRIKTIEEEACSSFFLD